MAEAVARHDVLMRRAITAHGGFVFKTIGDAFCAAFARPYAAIAAAVDAQRTLRAEDFSALEGVAVRMGLHTGTADECDAFGGDVQRASRLMGYVAAQYEAAGQERDPTENDAAFSKMIA